MHGFVLPVPGVRSKLGNRTSTKKGQRKKIREECCAAVCGKLSRPNFPLSTLLSFLAALCAGLEIVPSGDDVRVPRLPVPTRPSPDAFSESHDITVGFSRWRRSPKVFNNCYRPRRGLKPWFPKLENVRRYSSIFLLFFNQSFFNLRRGDT